MKKTVIKLQETKIHLTPEETQKLIVIAKSDGNRNRKNFCENEIRIIIKERYKPECRQ